MGQLITVNWAMEPDYGSWRVSWLPGDATRILFLSSDSL